MGDNDILKYCKNKNNIELRNKIIMDNEKLIHYAIKKYNWYFNNIDEYNDLIQEGFYIMCKSLDQYDPTKGALSTFFISQLRQMSRERIYYGKDIPLDTPLSYDENLKLEDTIEDENVKVEDDCIERAFYKEIREQVLSILSKEELNIIDLYYYKNFNLRAIADHLDIDYQKAVNIKQNALSKLKKSKFFRILYVENHVSLYKSPNYKINGHGTNSISRPTEEAVLKMESMDEYNTKKILKMYHHKKSVII